MLQSIGVWPRGATAATCAVAWRRCVASSSKPLLNSDPADVTAAAAAPLLDLLHPSRGAAWLLPDSTFDGAVLPPGQRNAAERFYARFGLTMQSPTLMLQPFIHSSALARVFQRYGAASVSPSDARASNTLLEFLGDAVLNVAVTAYVMHSSPLSSRGSQSQSRAVLRSNAVMTQVACSPPFSVTELLVTGRTAAGAADTKLYANCMEAVIGAVYADQGLEQCCRFLQHHVVPRAAEIADEFADNVTKFQELAHTTWRATPEYRLLKPGSTDGKVPHRIGVFLRGVLLAEASGLSQAAARKAAATECLALYNAHLDGQSTILSKLRHHEASPTG